eukprot:scaffold248340_cov40-Cyclotella_meneghiniana.AAC.2
MDNSRRIRTAAAAHSDGFSTKTDCPNVLPRRCECDGYCPLMDMEQLAYWAILIVDGQEFREYLLKTIRPFGDRTPGTRRRWVSY